MFENAQNSALQANITDLKQGCSGELITAKSLAPLQKTLMKSLKDATLWRHSRMEAQPFVVALTNGELPLNSYVAQLRAMAVIHGTLDHELCFLQQTPVTALIQARPSRLAQLRTDLGVFDKQHIPDCLEAVYLALHIAEQIRRTRLEQPDNLLAFLYVLEGTTLGNAVHFPDVVKTFSHKVAGATNYYAGYGNKTEEYWQEFRTVMNSLPMEDGKLEQLIRTAYIFFDLLEPLFASFYPINESGWGFTASMLNPEAGNHAVPNSQTEIEAAVRAAGRCREEYPYFDKRYGERGKSFAKSDAAWLATLANLPSLQRINQVEWLGRVLGNRGMPRITLERQLELLHEELTNAVHDPEKSYSGLLEAAVLLKEERLRIIQEPLFNQISMQFHADTNGEQDGKFARTGQLIVSAVCDEAAGISESVTSLMVWLTDKEKFSAQWITAVNKTVEKARKAIEG